MAVSAISGIMGAIGTAVAAGTIQGLVFFSFQGWAAFAALTATFTALGAISRALSGSPDLESMSGLNFNSRSAKDSRKLIYGEVRMAGTLVFIGTSGSDNRNLNYVIALAGNECNLIKEMYINDHKAWTNTGGLDSVYTKDGVDYAFIDPKPMGGGSTQADTALAVWDDDEHTLDDCCYAYVKLAYHGDIYTGGAPNVSFVIEGKRIYDPRQDNTSSVYDASLGVSTQRPDDPLTWRYSDNPAIVLLDYMRDKKFGVGEPLANFDLPTLAASADNCDEDVSLSAGGTQKRYTCNGVLDTRASHKANIENILSSMIGSCYFSGGKFYIKSYEYATPHTNVVDENMCVAPMELVTRQSRRNLYNAVKGQFVSDEEDYTICDYPAQIGKTASTALVTDQYYYITDVGTTDWTAVGASASTRGVIFKATGTTTGDGKASSYAGDDGEIIYLDLNLPMTKNNIRAQRIAKLTMLKSRLQAKIKMTLNMEAMKFRVGDNIKVSNARLGYVAKIFEIQSLQIVPSISGINVEIEATENASTAYNWTTSDEVDFTTHGEVPLYNGRTVATPTLASATPYTTVASDGTVVHKVDLAYSVTNEGFLDHYEILYAQTGTSITLYQYSGKDSTKATISGLLPNTQYAFLVIAVNQRGARSSASSILNATTGSDTVPKIPSFYRVSKTDDTAPTDGEFTAVAGRSKKDKDVVMTKNTTATPDKTHVWTYDLASTAWVADDDFVSGDTIINESITGDNIKATTVTANKFSGAVTEHSAFFYDYNQTATSSLTPWALAGVPATELSITKNRVIEALCEFTLYRYSSTPSKWSVIAPIQVEVPATSPNYYMGDCYYQSTPATNYQWVYSTGDYTNASGSFGYVSVTTAPSVLATIEGCYYDATNNRTYFLLYKYGTPLITASAGQHADLSYHPYGTSSAGAWVTMKTHSYSHFTISGTSTVQMPMRVSMGQRTEATNFRISLQNYSSSSVTIIGAEVTGSITSRM